MIQNIVRIKKNEVTSPISEYKRRLLMEDNFPSLDFEVEEELTVVNLVNFAIKIKEVNGANKFLVRTEGNKVTEDTLHRLMEAAGVLKKHKIKLYTYDYLGADTPMEKLLNEYSSYCKEDNNRVFMLRRKIPSGPLSFSKFTLAVALREIMINDLTPTIELYLKLQEHDISINSLSSKEKDMIFLSYLIHKGLYVLSKEIVAKDVLPVYDFDAYVRGVSLYVKHRELTSEQLDFAKSFQEGLVNIPKVWDGEKAVEATFPYGNYGITKGVNKLRKARNQSQAQLQADATLLGRAKHTIQTQSEKHIWHNAPKIRASVVNIAGTEQHNKCDSKEALSIFIAAMANVDSVNKNADNDRHIYIINKNIDDVLYTGEEQKDKGAYEVKTISLMHELTETEDRDIAHISWYYGQIGKGIIVANLKERDSKYSLVTIVRKADNKEMYIAVLNPAAKDIAKHAIDERNLSRGKPTITGDGPRKIDKIIEWDFGMSNPCHRPTNIKVWSKPINVNPDNKIKHIHCGGCIEHTDADSPLGRMFMKETADKIGLIAGKCWTGYEDKNIYSTILNAIKEKTKQDDKDLPFGGSINSEEWISMQEYLDKLGLKFEDINSTGEAGSITELMGINVLSIVKNTADEDGLPVSSSISFVSMEDWLKHMESLNSKNPKAVEDVESIVKTGWKVLSEQNTPYKLHMTEEQLELVPKWDSFYLNDIHTAKQVQNFIKHYKGKDNIVWILNLKKSEAFKRPLDYDFTTAFEIYGVEGDWYTFNYLDTDGVRFYGIDKNKNYFIVRTTRKKDGKRIHFAVLRD